MTAFAGQRSSDAGDSRCVALNEKRPEVGAATDVIVSSAYSQRPDLAIQGADAPLLLHAGTGAAGPSDRQTRLRP